MRHSTEVDLILDEVVPKDRKELVGFMLDMMRLMLTEERSLAGEKILLAAARIGMSVIKDKVSHDLHFIATNGTGGSGPGETPTSVGDEAVSDKVRGSD